MLDLPQTARYLRFKKILKGFRILFRIRVIEGGESVYGCAKPQRNPRGAGRTDAVR